jgi:hypothetical protein
MQPLQLVKKNSPALLKTLTYAAKQMCQAYRTYRSTDRDSVGSKVMGRKQYSKSSKMSTANKIRQLVTKTTESEAKTTGYFIDNLELNAIDFENVREGRLLKMVEAMQTSGAYPDLDKAMLQAYQKKLEKEDRSCKEKSKGDHHQPKTKASKHRTANKILSILEGEQATLDSVDFANAFNGRLGTMVER